MNGSAEITRVDAINLQLTMGIFSVGGGIGILVGSFVRLGIGASVGPSVGLLGKSVGWVWILEGVLGGIASDVSLYICTIWFEH